MADSYDDALRVAGKRLAAVVRAGIEGGELSLEQVGVELTNVVKRKVGRASPFGRIYVRSTGGRRRIHIASPPGAPPARDFGIYVNSWNWATSIERGRKYVDVGTADERGPHLEFGTSRMAARPHLRPSVEEYTGTLRETITAGIVERQVTAIRDFIKTLV